MVYNWWGLLAACVSQSDEINEKYDLKRNFEKHRQWTIGTDITHCSRDTSYLTYSPSFWHTQSLSLSLSLFVTHTYTHSLSFSLRSVITNVYSLFKSLKSKSPFQKFSVPLLLSNLFNSKFFLQMEKIIYFQIPSSCSR